MSRSFSDLPSDITAAPPKKRSPAIDAMFVDWKLKQITN